MSTEIHDSVSDALYRFIEWLDEYGETSWDHQSYFAGMYGGKAKALYYKNKILGTIAVSPMVISEALVPSGRRLFWKKQRLPIADAHYAMGFAYMYQITQDEKFYNRAVHFLEVLKDTRCPDYQHYCWGYPFDWETSSGTIAQGVPLITTTPYAYEAFNQIYEIDHDKQWKDILRSIAEHAYHDINDIAFSEDGNAASYTPDDDEAGVVNASAYRACLLIQAAKLFSEEKYSQKAQKNIKFILENQRPDGAWVYHADDTRDFIDNFHTCFVLKALAKIEKIENNATLSSAIDRGLEYYVNHLIDDTDRLKPFSKSPRLTVYKRELYDYAEFINVSVLLKGRNDALDSIQPKVVADILTRWAKKDGSFRSRKLFLGWDNVPMHRWAQSQLFRSLALMRYDNRLAAEDISVGAKTVSA